MKEKSAMPPGATLELYGQVKQLQAAGWKIGQISRRLNLNHTTVRKLVASPDGGKRAGETRYYINDEEPTDTLYFSKLA
jgi:orotate phosphoribosyltransferase-like protein